MSKEEARRNAFGGEPYYTKKVSPVTQARYHTARWNYVDRNFDQDKMYDHHGKL